MTPSITFCRAVCTFATTGFVAGLLPIQSVADTGPDNTEQHMLRLLREQGRALEHGEGVPQDLAKAISLYCEGARRGDLEAAYNLGWMYANGRGLTRDDSKAAAMFQYAADQRHEPSRKMLRFFRVPSAVLPTCMRGGATSASANRAGGLIWETDLSISRK